MTQRRMNQEGSFSQRKDGRWEAKIQFNGQRYCVYGKNRTEASNKLNELKQKLMNLKPNDFLKLFKEDKSIRAILDYYPIVTNSFNAINPDDIKEDDGNFKMNPPLRTKADVLALREGLKSGVIDAIAEGEECIRGHHGTRHR